MRGNSQNCVDQAQHDAIVTHVERLIVLKQERGAVAYAGSDQAVLALKRVRAGTQT